MKIIYCKRSEAEGHWLLYKWAIPVGWDRRHPAKPTPAKQRYKAGVRVLGVEVQFQRVIEPSVLGKAA